MTIWLHDLADAARSSGLEVIEVPNWRTRSAAPRGGRYGGPGLDAIEGVIIHHTATPETYSTNLDYPTYNVILQGNGSTGGPLSQLGLCRCGRHVYVFAAGICWHAGQVRDYSTQGNRVAIGIEAEHSGNPKDMPWPSERYSGYVILTAAILQWYRLGTSRAVGHKEASTTGKIDPLFDMGRFRADVDRARKTPTPPPTPADPNDGFTAAEIEAVQGDLNDLGYTDDDGRKLTVDGSLGPSTRQAVITYQRDHKLTPDGLPGPATNTSLEDTMSKIDQVLENQAAMQKQLETFEYNIRRLDLSDKDRATLATPLKSITPAGLSKVAALNAATARRMVQEADPAQRKHISDEADRVIGELTEEEEAV